MNSNLKTTKETLAILRCANNTFNSHLEKQAIKPIRVGTRSFFTLEQIEALKNSIANEPTRKHSDEPRESIEKIGRDRGQHSKELIEAQEEIQMLLMQVSQWQQQAQTYQEKYQKLLNNQQEDEKNKNVGEKRWWDTFFRKAT